MGDGGRPCHAVGRIKGNHGMRHCQQQRHRLPSSRQHGGAPTPSQYTTYAYQNSTWSWYQGIGSSRPADNMKKVNNNGVLPMHTPFGLNFPWCQRPTWLHLSPCWEKMPWLPLLLAVPQQVHSSPRVHFRQESKLPSSFLPIHRGQLRSTSWGISNDTGNPSDFSTQPSAQGDDMTPPSTKAIGATAPMTTMTSSDDDDDAGALLMASDDDKPTLAPATGNPAPPPPAPPTDARANTQDATQPEGVEEDSDHVGSRGRLVWLHTSAC